MKFAFVAAEKAFFPVAFMCRNLQVSRSGFYAWQLRPESRRTKEDRRLKVGIRADWKRSRRTYGNHRIHDDLKDEGEKVSRKRVLRLMKEDNVVGKQRRRRFVVTTNSKHSLPIAPNVLDRKFEVSTPNRARVGDITYLRTLEGWLYLATSSTSSPGASLAGRWRSTWRRAWSPPPWRWRCAAATSMASCCTTPTAAARVDSIGRRNAMRRSCDGSEALGKSCRAFPDSNAESSHGWKT